MRWLMIVGLLFVSGSLAVAQDKGLAERPSSEASSHYVLEPKSWENRDPEALPARAIARLGTQRFRHPTSYAGHNKVVTSDGRLLITGGDQRLRLWELPTGKLLYEFCHGHSHLFNLVLSPNDRWLVGRYEKPFCFDLSTRKMVKEFGEKKSMPLCFSPDSRQLLVNEPTELVWYDTATWEAKERWKLPENYPIHQAQFIDQGARLQTVSWYPTKRIAEWDLKTGKIVKENTLEVPQQRTASLTKDGRYLVVVPYSKEAVQIYDIETGQKIRELQGEQACSNYGLVFTPDGKTLLTDWYFEKMEHFQISLWDFETGKLKNRFNIKGSGDYLFLPDGRTLLCGRRQLFSLYDSVTGQPLHSGIEHLDSITDLQFSPDGQSLFAAGSTLIRWDVSSRKPVQSYEKKYVHKKELTPDGTALVFTDGFSQIRTVDARTGKEMHVNTVPREDNWDLDPDHQPHFGSAHLAADGQSYFVMATLNGYQMNGQQPVQGWSQWHQIDVKTGRALWKGNPLAQTHYSHVMNDGLTLLSIETQSLNKPPGTIQVESPDKSFSQAPRTNYCVLFDLKNSRRRAVFAIPNRSAYRFDDSPRGSSLLTSSSKECGKNAQGWGIEEYAIHLWEPASGKMRLAIPLREQSVLHWFLGKLVFSPDARRIAGFRIDGSIMLWDAITGDLLWEQPTQMTKVQSAAFSPDGTVLATGHEDSTIVLWNVADLQSKRTARQADSTDLQAWWNQLGDKDARMAYQTIWKLVEAGQSATKFIDEHVRPIKPIDPTQVNQWIEELDSKAFATRDAASNALAQAGHQVETQLENTLKQELKPETRKAPSTDLGSSRYLFW
ncbi:MAG: WD40 repeat domain-containing protein [Gemmatales bacterium]